MLKPVAALQCLASRKRTLDLYLQVKKEETHYGFRISDFNLLLRPQENVEVIEMIPACPIPNTPRWFAGMINLRGNLLPVFDIRLLLTGATPEPSRWIMIFGRGSRASGLYADTLPFAVKPGNKAGEPQDLPDFFRDCVEMALIQGNDVWLEVKFDRLFANLRNRF